MIIGHYTIRVFSLSRRVFTLLRHYLSKKTRRLAALPLGEDRGVVALICIPKIPYCIEFTSSWECILSYSEKTPTLMLCINVGGTQCSVYSVVFESI